jgi:hypothetical protein
MVLNDQNLLFAGHIAPMIRFPILIPLRLRFVDRPRACKRDMLVLSGGDLENSLRQVFTSSAQPSRQLCLKFLCDDVMGQASSRRARHQPRPSVFSATALLQAAVPISFLRLIRDCLSLSAEPQERES